jgi:two-component system sensor histidine kinase SenX3
MRVRLARGLLAPIALLTLVGSLATLQYRWLGQVSEAERDQLRRSLDRRAHEFADDFDREITRVYNGLQPAGPVDPAAPEAFSKKYDAWVASATTPGLVRTVYMARPRDKEKDAGFELFRYDAAARAFHATAWPPELDVVRSRMTGTIDDEGKGPNLQRIVTINSTSVVPEVPALLLPMPVRSDVVMPSIGRGANFDHDLLMALKMSHSHLIVQLDANTLSAGVLPALMLRHFGETGASGYRVSVVDMASKPIASMNVAENDRIDPDRADVNETFFTVRPDVVRSATLTWTAPVSVPAGGKGAVVRPAGTMTANQFTAVAVTPLPPGSAQKGSVVSGSVTGPMGVRISTGAWRLLVQHSAGSLDAAVGSARRHNLLLSFGILAVLAASVGLIVINARRSERLAAQQMDFVATVSHELRTPLAVIRSAAQNLSAGVVHEASQAQRYGDLIETEGRRLTEMIEQVLEYAGLEGNRRALAAQPFDPGRLVSDVVLSCSALFEAEGCEVTTAIGTDLPAVAADEGALRRALNNLLTNALKYAAGGRTVHVDVQAAQVRGQQEVQIAVSDRGPGIDAEDLAHIFEPFYRGRYATERQIHGNGLGLSLVKRIAEAYGGRVAVKSTPGAGATFTLHLPAAAAHAAVQPLEPAPDAGGTAAS